MGGILVVVISMVPTWLAVTSMGAISAVAIIGMAITGRAVATVIGIIIGEIRTADGVGGTVTDGVLPEPASCSLAALASRGGGAGAGVLGQTGAGAGAAAGAGEEAGDPLTATTVTGPIIPITAMATDTAPGIRLRTASLSTASLSTASLSTASLSTVSTETAANPESPSCNDGCHGLAITMAPSTESLVRRPGAQSGITSKHTAT